ncbi:MAG: hypothetical protein ACM3SS_23725 [Rhodospirillaceae bacterium]
MVSHSSKARLAQALAAVPVQAQVVLERVPAARRLVALQLVALQRLVLP